MGDSGNPLTVVLQIAADSSQADALLAALPAEVQVSVQSSAEAFSGLKGGTDVANEGILNARESTRLLAEEFGIHLPRAVTSAISGMLPEIAGLGTGLLAVFAVEEVIKFAAHVRKLADEFNGVAEAQKLISNAAKESDTAMEAMAKKSEAYARQQIALLSAQIAAQEAHVNALQDENEGISKQTTGSAALDAAMGQIVQSYHFWTGGTKELKGATADLRAEEELRDKIVKILGGDEETAHKKAAEAAKQHAAELKRLAEAELRAGETAIQEAAKAERELDKFLEHRREEFEKLVGISKENTVSFESMQQAVRSSGLAAAGALSPLTALGGGIKQLTEAERAALPLANDLGLAIQREAQRLSEMRQEMDSGTLPAVKRIILAYDQQMDTAEKNIQLMQQEYQQHKITRAQMEAGEEAYTEIVVNSAALRTAAMKQETLQQASTLATALGLEKEFVIAEATYLIPKNLAEGFSALGSGDFWSATQYFLSAAQWGVAAGKAVATIAGGGGGGSSSSAGGTAVGSSSSSGGGGGGGGGGSSTVNSVIRVELPSGNAMLPASYVQNLINQINTQVQNNNVTLHATYSRSLARRT